MDTNISIDNTNADVDVRKKWVGLAVKHSVPIRCVHFTATIILSEHNAAVRAFNKGVSDPLSSTQCIRSQRRVAACKALSHMDVGM